MEMLREEETKSVCFTRWPNARVVAIQCDTSFQTDCLKLRLPCLVYVMGLGIFCFCLFLSDLLYTGSSTQVDESLHLGDTGDLWYKERSVHYDSCAFAVVSFVLLVFGRRSVVWLLAIRFLHCIYLAIAYPSASLVTY